MANMIKKGSARWTGGLKNGLGNVSTESGALSEQPYGFNTRFEGKAGTNPEELLGAAHAGCFSMALSMMLEQAGLTAEKIETTAAVKLEKQDDGFAITNVHLVLAAQVPGTDMETFTKIANDAKAGCPVSKLFTGAEITLDARLM